IKFYAAGPGKAARIHFARHGANHFGPITEKMAWVSAVSRISNVGFVACPFMGAFKTISRSHAGAWE
ncbi:MAG: hypothetical protein QGI90_10425, partial [Nitrospinaceae bacterium]|nr:hypothetical protein [Nitrospinaceae bacterium]